MAEALGMNVAVLRLLAAYAGALLFGIERQLRIKPVGFSTFTFVSTGSCLLTLIVVSVGIDKADAILGGIITGVGFLGAGALVKFKEKRVFGFTTAAAIWAFAAFGITIGVGLYYLAFVFYLLIVFIVVLDYYFEQYGFGLYSKILTLTCDNINLLKQIELQLTNSFYKIINYEYDNTNKSYTLNMQVSGNKKQLDSLVLYLFGKKGVKSVNLD